MAELVHCTPELGARLNGLISSLAREDREHFRSTLAKIIAGGQTCGPACI